MTDQEVKNVLPPSAFSTMKTSTEKGVELIHNLMGVTMAVDVDAELHNETQNVSSVTSDDVDIYVVTPERLLAGDILENKVALALLTYVLPVIIFAGTFGNIISFAVLMRKRMRSTSVYFYLAVLALVDTAVLYLSAFKTWFRLLTGIEALHFSVVSCKLLTFLFLLALHLSAWLIVMITFERFIVVWFPFKAPAFCSIKRAAILLAWVGVILVVYNIHLLWTFNFRIIPRPNGPALKICAPAKDNYFMNNVFDNMKLVSYSILPFIFVTIFNLSIIVKVYQHTQVPTLSSCSKVARNRIRSQNRITYMLLAISFVWLALTAPYTIWSLVGNKTPTTAEQAAKAFLWKTVCFLLMYLNHSINFYLYCVAGKRFRREIKELFCVSLVYRLRIRRLSTKTLRTPIMN